MIARPGLEINRVSIFAAILALIIVAWIPATYLYGRLDFAVLTPAAQSGLESASAIARLFAAMVLLLLPKARYGRSIRWLAAGFIVLSVGSIAFGSLPATFGYATSMNDTVIGSLVVMMVTGILFLVGLLPERTPRMSWSIMLLAIAAVLLIKVVTVTMVETLPRLWRDGDPLLDPQTHALGGATVWYWVLVPIPFIIAVSAVWAALTQFRKNELPGWVVISLVIWAGAQLHNFFWPSTYDLVVTTTDALRFLFAMTIVLAGTLALSESAREYARLLQAERQMHRQLALNATFKNDFTRMVAHELGSPVAAIRRFVEIAQFEQPSPRVESSLQAINLEARAIEKLVSDIQAIASVESDDFSVDLQPVSIDQLVDEASAFGVTFSPDHPFQLSKRVSGYVIADSARISQVLRNLIDNAARYSPPGAPIELNVIGNDVCVRFEVRDQGFGIAHNEIERIFEKYERGGHRGPGGRPSRGVGLGLYLSRQIVRAHGSEIGVVSAPGKGSTFRFTLEVAR